MVALVVLPSGRLDLSGGRTRRSTEPRARMAYVRRDDNYLSPEKGRRP